MMVDSALTSERNGPDAPRATHKTRRFWAIAILALLMVVFVVVRAMRKSPESVAAAAQAASYENRAVSIQVVVASRADVPVVLEGLGNVTPIATVVVKSQVDGRLEKTYFKEGEPVKKGQLLAQIDARPFQIQLQQGEAALARDTAVLANAKLDLGRYQTLGDQKLAPQQQVDTQRTLVAQTEAAILADQAQIASAKLNLNYSRIASPIAGVTGVRLVDPGNIVHGSDSAGIVVVTQLDPIAVMFTLPEDDQPRISQAMSQGRLGVDAYSRDGAKKLGSGEVLLIDNQINTTTATIRLKAAFANTDHALWPNAFVKARLTLATHKGALALPNSTVQRGPQGTFVYVVKNDQTVEVRSVEIDTIQGDSAIIRAGLDVGEKVVSEGQNQLRPGAKVAIRSAPEPASSAAPRKPQ
jgi:membrane fusion protein, multidrug efflux system